ncbi:hypothetical protein LJR129_004525 [Acidovorax sp. LjRoot129]|uniref:hypothetical protein n=1 Tax=Acidovorax sp. LjRoot129 TaxID=3342260 RepID=UPI003ECE0BD7
MTAEAAGTASRNVYEACLAQHLATQPHNVMAHVLGHEQIWIKRAGTPHGTGRYRAMALLAGLLRLDVLRPVPNPGGPAAIATEVRRLQDLAARGIRVPAVVAAQPDGFAMRHLGRMGEETHSLGNEIDHAVQAGDATEVLALWQQGLDTLAHVHRQGTCLSQAFARNLVRCPDGEVACIDFEDDPAAVLPLAVCHARDALCYAHSTAIYLHQSQTLAEARQRWGAWVAQSTSGLQAELASSLRRMRWMRHLPTSRRLGRDLQRVRAAYDLLKA